jgi:hypothetical protein
MIPRPTELSPLGIYFLSCTVHTETCLRTFFPCLSMVLTICSRQHKLATCDTPNLFNCRDQGPCKVTVRRNLHPYDQCRPHPHQALEAETRSVECSSQSAAISCF